MWHFITNRSIFEVTVYSYVFANKASQSETKIENKYCQCKINIFKHLVFRKLCTMFTQQLFSNINWKGLYIDRFMAETILAAMDQKRGASERAETK